MTDTHVAREKLVQDFSAVIADTEQLLKTVASAGGEKAQAVRADLERNLRVARERLVKLEKDAVERTRAAAKATDEYVHVHPWQSMLVAAGVAAAAGIVVGLLLNRR
jgi:ElaB/YqjD/DUF883 family membrane-anchored ribosome-binding protein